MSDERLRKGVFHSFEVVKNSDPFSLPSRFHLHLFQVATPLSVLLNAASVGICTFAFGKKGLGEYLILSP